MLTRKEAAKLFGISGDALYHYARTGKIKSVLSDIKSGKGHLRLYDEEDIIRLKKELDAVRSKRTPRKKKRTLLPRLPRLETKKPSADFQPESPALPAVSESKPQEAEKRAPSLPRHYKVQVYLDADVVEEFEKRADEPYGAEACINEALRAYLRQGGDYAGDYARLIEDERFIQAVTERVSERMAQAVAARSAV